MMAMAVKPWGCEEVRARSNADRVLRDSSQFRDQMARVCSRIRAGLPKALQGVRSASLFRRLAVFLVALSFQIEIERAAPWLQACVSLVDLLPLHLSSSSAAGHNHACATASASVCFGIAILRLERFLPLSVKR